MTVMGVCAILSSLSRKSIEAIVRLHRLAGYRDTPRKRRIIKFIYLFGGCLVLALGFFVLFGAILRRISFG